MNEKVNANQNQAVQQTLAPVQPSVQPSAQPSVQPVVTAPAETSFNMTPVGQELQRFNMLQRMAKMYTMSTLVPVTYQGDKNIGNCVIALDMASRMQANPLMVMQNLFVVHGNPSFSSKFLIATINACGRFTPLRYEFQGEANTMQYACRAFAYESTDKEHKEPLYGDWVTLQMAKDEGWSTKPGSKWKTMPGQMLRYRAAAFWQRVFAPEISMGFLTTEEAYEMADAVEVRDERTAEAVMEKASEIKDKVEEAMRNVQK